MATAKPHSMYDDMEFAPYEFREYPKWVKGQLVQNAAEELAVDANAKVAVETDPTLAKLQQAEKEKTELLEAMVAMKAELEALKAKPAEKPAAGAK